MNTRHCARCGTTLTDDIDRCPRKFIATTLDEGGYPTRFRQLTASTPTQAKGEMEVLVRRRPRYSVAGYSIYVQIHESGCPTDPVQIIDHIMHIDPLHHVLIAHAMANVHTCGLHPSDHEWTDEREEIIWKDSGNPKIGRSRRLHDHCSICGLRRTREKYCVPPERWTDGGATVQYFPPPTER